MDRVVVYALLGQAARCSPPGDDLSHDLYCDLTFFSRPIVLFLLRTITHLITVTPMSFKQSLQSIFSE